MKKLLILLFVLAAAVPADARSLVIVCDEWPPYQTIENGKIGGFSTEVVKTVLGRMQVGIESLEHYPWKRALMMMENAQTDALFSANFTQKRTAFAHYPDAPIVHSPWVMWVRKEDHLTFESYEDLKGKKVGVVRGYSYTPEFWAFVKRHDLYEEVTSDEQNFKKLHLGRVNYALAEMANGFQIIKKLGLKDIVPLKDHPVKSDGLYIIFNKKRVAETFVRMFSEELKKFRKEPVYQQLYDQHVGSGQ